MPAVQYYQMNGEPGCNESAFLAKAQNAGDDGGLLRRLQDPDAAGEGLRQAGADPARSRRLRVPRSSRAAGNPNAYAAVAASGMPELAGLPNTVAGWGLAFLRAAQGGRRDATRSSACTSRVGQRQGHAALQRHRSARTRGRQGLQVPRAARPRAESDRRRPTTCWSAIRSIATPTTTDARAEPLVGCERHAPRSTRRASTATPSGCGCGT